MTNTGAILLVKCLEKMGVKTIFGIPGAKIDTVFDALLDSPIKLILCRHEQNAAFMAAAYGRITGKPGVVLVTSGPGVSNLATGLLTATTEGDPIVAIGGNVSRNMKLKASHQSTDNIKLMEAVTKDRMEALMAENIPEIVSNAFRIAAEPKSGAVFISMPQDVLLEKTNASANENLTEIAFGSAAKSAIEQAAIAIQDAKNPVLLLGMEASRTDNAEAIRILLTKHKLATVGTYQAAGVISRELLDCFVGRVGLFKNQPGDNVLDEADLVITVGYNTVEYDPEVWNAKGGKKIIHIDYQPASIHATYLPSLELVGDIAANLQALSEKLPVCNKLKNSESILKQQKSLVDKIETGKSKQGALMHPLRFIHELRNNIDDDTTIVSDIGTHYMWLARYLFSYKPHHLLFSNGQQTLGVALPWAMAACYARPKSKVISISGDGGFLFSAMELETAVREKLHFVHCVWRDGSYNMVKEQQLMKYDREASVEFGRVDLVKFAESFGAHGFLVKDSNEFSSILQQALQLPGPVLIEVPIDYSDNPELFKTAYENLGH